MSNPIEDVFDALAGLVGDVLGAFGLDGPDAPPPKTGAIGVSPVDSSTPQDATLAAQGWAKSRVTAGTGGFLKAGTGAGLATLTLKCDPKVAISVTDSRIKKALSLMGADTVDIEWQWKPGHSYFALGKYKTPRYDPDRPETVFDVCLWRVDERSGYFEHLEKEQKNDNPAYWVYADYAYEIAGPPVWTGKLSRSKPVKLSLPAGYYIIGPPNESKWKGADLGTSDWWVTDLESNGSTWKGWKDFWSKDSRVTDFYRFRHFRWWRGADWFRMIHLDQAAEGFTFKPRFNLRYQDFGNVPKDWKEKLASWAETQAENLWTNFKEFWTG